MTTPSAGSPTVSASYRHLISLAAPLMMAMMAYAILLLTDRLFLGRLGSDQLAAGVAVGFIGFLLQSLFVCTAVYVSTFVAQHYGAGEFDKVGEMTWPGIWVVLIGGVFCLALIPFAPWIFALCNPTPGVSAQIAQYAPWIFASTVPSMIVSVLNAFFAGIGRTRLVMVFNVAMCVLNAGFNAVLIFGLAGFPALGTRGAGIGTLVATTIVAIAAVAVFFNESNRERFGTWKTCGWNGERMRRFLRFSLPQGFRILYEALLWNAFMFAMGWLGYDAFVASGIVMTWNNLTYTALNGLNQAVAVVVGQAIGAGKSQLANAACHRALILLSAYVALIFVLCLGFPDALMMPFLDKETLIDEKVVRHVVELGRTLLLISAFWTLGDGFTFLYMGALNGAGDTAWQLKMFVVMSLIFLVAPIVAVIAAGERFWARFGLEPVEAAWIASLLFLFVLAVLMARRFYRGPWRELSLRG